MGHPKSRRNDGTADGTAISKYIGRDSRRNSNKLDRTTERPTKNLWRAEHFAQTKYRETLVCFLFK